MCSRSCRFPCSSEPRVPDAQARQISESSVFAETRRLRHCSPHSPEEVSATYTGGRWQFRISRTCDQGLNNPTLYECSVSRAAQGTHAFSSHVPTQQSCRVGYAQLHQQAQPEVHDCREVERTTHRQ